jgi:hypothetical protein
MITGTPVCCERTQVTSQLQNDAPPLSTQITPFTTFSDNYSHYHLITYYSSLLLSQYSIYWINLTPTPCIPSSQEQDVAIKNSKVAI